MEIREMTEQMEHQLLRPAAQFSDATRGRLHPVPRCSVRTEYQRDRDRIIHSKAFRRLKHKTQVFLSPEGDHYRTRLTHTLEVSQIARTIARALRLNEDLTEAVALGHDLGHTPFGHTGEAVLNEICPQGFRHNEQSLRVVDVLEREGGLNLTHEVRDGILCHTGGKQADTLEGQIVRFADKIAYINHDIDDAVRGGVLTEEELPGEYTRILGTRHSQRINHMINAIILASRDRDAVVMEEETYDAMMGLRAFMFERVYLNPEPKAEEEKARGIIRALYQKLTAQPELVPAAQFRLSGTEDIAVAAADYIAGMSDPFAVAKFNEWFVPAFWQ